MTMLRSCLTLALLASALVLASGCAEEPDDSVDAGDVGEHDAGGARRDAGEEVSRDAGEVDPSDDPGECVPGCSEGTCEVDDGCGGTCGCADDETCSAGACVCFADCALKH